MADPQPLVLCVEDDANMRVLIERYLQGAGCEVRAAADGDEALRRLRAERPDVVLTDVMMPGMSGYDFCARLQADPELALIPVIFLTALDTERDKARALACGAADFLTKPLAKDALLEAVRRLARTRGQWAALAGARAAPAGPSKDLPRFRDWLLERLKIPPERRALLSAAPGGLYALAARLGATAAQAAEHAAAFCGVAFLPRINPDSIELGVLPTAFCRANRVVAIRNAEGRRAFVLSDPFDEDLRALLGRQVPGGEATPIFVAEPSALDSLLSRPAHRGPGPLSTADLERFSVVELATHLLEAAVRERASDIHVEPKTAATLVRFRVDGDLREVYSLRPETGLMLISRFKALGELDIAERRKPQDGAMPAAIGGRDFVVRLATTSTPAGESLIMRLLEPWAAPKPLGELGMSAEQVRHMVEFARRNHGLVIIAGPTGSGKTTTIYSLLQHVDTRTRSLISVEDPIEYRLSNANQQQVDEKAGVTFEALLKSSLRQDPDILFLGEMRDPFSAKTAIDFASTGHLTISSIHTTNATTAIFRLERLGIGRGAMADSLLGVVAQKLVKKLCEHCKSVGPISAEERTMLAGFAEETPERVARATGCERCGGTGYWGREGVYEIVKFYPEISEMIRAGAPISDIRDFARRRGDLLLADHAVEKVRALVFDPRHVYETVLLEESEYRRRAPAAPAAGPAAPASPTVPAERPAVPAEILVVEDDPDTRAFVRRVLENRGHAVTTAEDGVEALMQLGRKRFDLILSDVNMPNLDGLRLLELKALKKIAAPVVFLSAAAEAEALALEFGAQDYIRKPVTKEVLVARVRLALGRGA